MLIKSICLSEKNKYVGTTKNVLFFNLKCKKRFIITTNVMTSRLSQQNNSKEQTCTIY